MTLRAALTCWLFQIVVEAAQPDWAVWWTYSGFSGPDYWGKVYTDLRVCNEGRRQSPIDLEPSKLLFDSNLKAIHIDKHRISGILNNTGHDVTFTVDSGSDPVHITLGPLSYRHTFERMQLHFGISRQYHGKTSDVAGSEHLVNGLRFPAEIQLIGYNSELYDSFREAENQTYGIVAISILIQIGEPNLELRILLEAVKRTIYLGDSTVLEHISPCLLLPNTEYFMTYEGSLTSPACHETVTWLVFNKPIYMSYQQLHLLQKLKKSTPTTLNKQSLGNNFRPVQNLNHRVIRTNIGTRWKNQKGCSSMKTEMGYKAADWLEA